MTTTAIHDRQGSVDFVSRRFLRLYLAAIDGDARDGGDDTQGATHSVFHDGVSLLSKIGLLISKPISY
jgi:hypothetical protein